MPFLRLCITFIPKSTHIERMEENINVFDFELTEEDMAVIATLDKKQSSFFFHTDPGMVEWFVRMVEERKKNYDCTKEVITTTKVVACSNPRRVITGLTPKKGGPSENFV